MFEMCIYIYTYIKKKTKTFGLFHILYYVTTNREWLDMKTTSYIKIDKKDNAAIAGKYSGQVPIIMMNILNHW